MQLHLMHCTMLLLAHIRSFMLGYVEAELEELMKQAQVEEFTNLALDQSKPRCIPPIVIGCSLITIFRLCLFVH
jgi:hypothetical protein